MIKKTPLIIAALLIATTATAQFKPRPDAFPPVPEDESKAITMATTVEQMASWDRYPTYPVYLEMMQRWVDIFPQLCHVDTIGTSVNGRLILSMYIQPQTVDDLYRPEFFYSSTIHGDEVTGYVMMLRLIDTLLHGYGSNPQYTDLINRTRISINPLANPDGTYRRNDNTIQGAVRYNANNVDLNRNYPDPFGSSKEALQQENAAMIAYFEAHNFRLSANLHGGSEVMNYPWDCFTSTQNPHPDAEWWKAVCHRFVDTSRNYSSNHFNDVPQADDGVIAGGDWYVIHGGRQDYVNYYHNCLELTMEISTQKTLSSNRLPDYWSFLQHPLVNYISEIHNLPGNTPPEPPVGIESAKTFSPTVYPNPATDRIVISGAEDPVEIYDATGRLIHTQATKQSDNQATTIDISGLPAGIYLLRIGSATTTVVKRP